MNKKLKKKTKKLLNRDILLLTLTVVITTCALFGGQFVVVYFAGNLATTKADETLYHVQGRTFETITESQYDKLVDIIYKVAGKDTFEVQYALTEVILNDIESDKKNMKDIDKYLNTLYQRLDPVFSQDEFYDENNDYQTALLEAVQAALDERTMPSGVTKFGIVGAPVNLKYSFEKKECDVLYIYYDKYIKSKHVEFYYDPVCIKENP